MIKRFLIKIKVFSNIQLPSGCREGADLPQLPAPVWTHLDRLSGRPTFNDPVDEQRSVSMDGALPPFQSEVDPPSSFLQLYAQQRPLLLSCHTDMQVRWVPLVESLSVWTHLQMQRLLLQRLRPPPSPSCRRPPPPASGCGPDAAPPWRRCA